MLCCSQPSVEECCYLLLLSHSIEPLREQISMGKGRPIWRTLLPFKHLSPWKVAMALISIILAASLLRQYSFIGDELMREKAKAALPGMFTGENFWCDRTEFHSDVCNMRGDVRMDAKSSTFLLLAANSDTILGEEKIKPYSRKWEKPAMDTVHEIQLKSLPVAKNPASMNCEVVHEVPGVVFSTGGYTGNLFHEINDGFIPLFITSQHLKGEVVYIITDFHNWWMSKYDEVLRHLTNYPVINFENETRIHCFPEVSIGLFYHSELAINPSAMPHHETIQDFRDMLDRAYAPTFPESFFNDSMKPRLTLIVRDESRVILNQDRMITIAEELGFEVLVWKPDRTTMLRTTFSILNASHVVMGVHGAALTHFLFMRPGSVFIQIIPFGTEWAAPTYFGDPASKFGLQYIAYKINPTESTLIWKYDKNDTVFTNPLSIFHKHGWAVLKTIYLEAQNVTLSLPRIHETLLDAKRKAIQFMKRDLD